MQAIAPLKEVMMIFKGVIMATTVAVAAMAVDLAHGTTLQISQVAETPPDLAVFISGGPVSQRSTNTATDPTISAAWGSASLPIKSSMPWEAKTGVSLVIALDASASIGKRDFEIVRRQVAGLVAKLPSLSRVALIGIGTNVRVLQHFGPASEIPAALETLVPDSSETALYEGVLFAQELAAQTAPSLPLRRLVFVVTDGIDDSRKGFSREEALKKIEEGGAPIFALALAPARPPAAQLEAIKTLAQIARASGGAFVQSTAADVGGNLEALLNQAMQTQLLMLDCSACLRDGSARPLQVSVRQRDGGPLTGSRELRLVALPAKPRPAESEPPPPKPPPPSILQQPDPWVWLVAIGSVLAAVGLGLWIHYYRRVGAASRSEHGDADQASMNSFTYAGTAGDLSYSNAKQSGLPVTLDVAGQGRMQMRVGESDVVLGRSKSADIAVIEDSEASNSHAALYVYKDALMLRDLGSSNGTYLNGARIVRAEPLQDRDLVLVGRTEVRVYLGTT